MRISPWLQMRLAGRFAAQAAVGRGAAVVPRHVLRHHGVRAGGRGADRHHSAAGEGRPQARALRGRLTALQSP